MYETSNGLYETLIQSVAKCEISAYRYADSYCQTIKEMFL